MNLKTIAEQLNMRTNDVLVKATSLNLTYDLGIDDLDNLNRVQYDIIRASLDTNHLVNLITGGSKNDRKYNYQNTPDFHDLVHWVSQRDLNGVSTSHIKESLPEHITHRGLQTIAAAMRSAGYESRVTYLGDDQQGRRWSKEEEPTSFFSDDTPSFL